MNFNFHGRYVSFRFLPSPISKSSLSLCMKMDSSMQEKLPNFSSQISDLKKLSNSNVEKIAILRKKLKLSKEQQERSQYSKRIRNVNMRLLMDLLRNHYWNEGLAEEKINAIRKLFDSVCDMEELKMALEYENTRMLYAIAELQRTNSALERMKNGLLDQSKFTRSFV